MPALLRFAFVTAAVLALSTSALRADPICCGGEKGPTLVGDFKDAHMVLLGRFSNARKNPNDPVGGETDFVIETVYKPHDFLKGRKSFPIAKYLPNAKNPFLIFCDVHKDVPDPYRGVEVLPSGELLKYFEGALKVKDRPLPERLRYAFDYLNHPEIDVAMDAFREFARSSYKEYREMAVKLPADKIARWLRDPKTPLFRYGLFAMLLGQCGGAKDAELLRQMIDDPRKRPGTGVEGLLAGYLILKPKEAWPYTLGLLKNEKEEFLLRYSVLRTMRFMYDQRPDVVPRKDLVAGMALVLDFPDLADFAVEDLRRCQRWEMTDRVLALYGKASHDIPVIRRAILRFALCSPEKRAVQFVQEQRRRDPELVRDIEEFLKLEAEAK
jgi:hypothetical protein